MIEIQGDVADGYGKVVDAFARNFDQHDDLGAAFSVYVDGVKKADIWAGVADSTTGAPWTEDTLQLVFSTTKGAAAICVAKLVEEGRLDYDGKVADVWPEFEAAGNHAVLLTSVSALSSRKQRAVPTNVRADTSPLHRSLRMSKCVGCRADSEPPIRPKQWGVNSRTRTPCGSSTCTHMLNGCDRPRVSGPFALKLG